MTAGPEDKTHIKKKKVKSRVQGSPFLDVLIFLIPFVQFVRLKMIGVLSGSDILLLATFVCLVISRKVKIEPPVAKWLLLLCSLWLASQCVTDIVRHTAFADYARGWSNIGFTIVNFTVYFTLLYGNRRRLIFFGWGLVFGTLLTVLVNPDEYMLLDPWKFGFSNAFSWAVLLIASSESCRNDWAIVLSGMAGVVNFLMNARSIGGICLATALYLVITRVMRRRSKQGKKLKTSSILAIGALTILGAVGIFSAYKYAARTGMLGDEARQKYETQSSGRFGLLLGGRTEMLGYLPAIYDSPILGHGSWAKDPVYLLLERQALARFGYEDAQDLSADSIREGLIPAHSYIFGAWVNAGILGAFFWVFISVVTVKVFFRLYTPGAILVPLSSFAAIFMIWNLLFAPYGAEMRIITPYYIVLLISSLPLIRVSPVAIPIRKTKKRLRRLVAADPKAAS